VAAVVCRADAAAAKYSKKSARYSKVFSRLNIPNKTTTSLTFQKFAAAVAAPCEEHCCC